MCRQGGFRGEQEVLFERLGLGSRHIDLGVRSVWYGLADLRKGYGNIICFQCGI